MGQYSAAERRVSVKRSTDVGERIVDFLRSRYPTKTAECVAADTGIAASTVGKWIERASIPGGLAIFVMTAVYGPGFLNSVMIAPPAWIDEAARAEEQRRLKAEIAALQEKLERSA